MNKKEIETGETYREWTDVIDIVRKELNAYRKKTLKKNPEYKWPDTLKKPKFKVGDVVHPLLDRPKNALGNTLGGDKFRTGDFRWDPVPKKIIRVIPYPGQVPYRYLLEGKPNVSFTAQQLRLVWWKTFKKAEATWEPSTQLTEDGFAKEIKAYNVAEKEKSKKKKK